MDHRTAPRSLVIALLATAFALLALPAAAQNKDAAAKALQKEAIEKHYLALDFPKALATLDKAVTLCGADKCSAPVRATVKRDIGVVQSAAGDKDKATAAFVEAIKIDPKVELDPDLKNTENTAAFEAAKKQAGGGAAAGGAAVAATGEQPTGDFTHTPAAEQQVRTPIPVYLEYAGEEPLSKIVVRYKGFGMTDWKQVELKKLGEKGWGGLLPCADVQQGVTQYYIQGFNANNDVTATAGDRNKPYRVPVKREKVAEAPHLPGEPPPAACQDTGDCPPNFPGCKKPGAGAVVSEGPTGKDGGEYCEEDSECKSSKCETNKCTEPDGGKKAPKFWIGVHGAFDYTFLSSADDVCKLRPPNDPDKPLQPLNDSGYYCVNSDGSDYPYRPINAQDAQSNPRGQENTRLVTGTSDKVNGGGVFGNIRFMASVDYAVNLNILVGMRVGFVLNTYPGQAAKDDGKTFPPLHLEVRGTYLFGKDALVQKLAPYAMVGAGVSTWDAKVSPVSVVEQDAASKRTAKDVDAWKIAGPGFFALGGGVRVGFSPRAAFMGGLRLNLAFGNSFAPSIGPEVGVVFGF